MSKKFEMKHIEPVVWFAGVLVVWELMARFFIPPWLLPTPSSVIYELFTFQAMWYHFSHSLFITLAGFGMAIVGGIILGILIFHSARAERGLSLILFGTYAVPLSSFTPLFIVWFGYGDFVSIFVVFIMAFFPILVNTIAGMKATGPEMLNLLRSFRASKFQILAKARIPRSLPYIFTGLRISAPLSIIGAVVVDFFQGYRGLGHLIMFAATFLNIPLTFAAILAMAIVGLCLYWAVIYAERLLLPWYRR